MKNKPLLALALTLMALLISTETSAKKAVLTGIDVLTQQQFKCLQGKRVGLITNPTGVNARLVSTVDVLKAAPGVNLVALYGPEHGVRGDIHAGDKVETARDAKTGLPVFSLYGKTRKPTPEMLKDVDVLVYDIQDIGCRSFTFISTMGLAMEAAAENGKEFVVLGLTCGELARMLNDEGMLKGGVRCKLTVVKMKHWRRTMGYADTGLQWIASSPHIPQAVTAYYYPTSGILGELGYLSIGVGYTIPFQMFAAPWIDAVQLAEAMNAHHLPGVTFRPIYVKPFYSVGKGELLQGVQMHITDFQRVQLTPMQFVLIEEVARLYPQHAVLAHADSKRFDMFDKVSGSKQVRIKMALHNRWADLKPFWDKDVAAFRALSKKYHLYK